MSNFNKTCSKCGGIRRAQVLNGLCPACLLGNGKQTKPLVNLQDLGAVQSLVGADYEVLELIGRGGMGTVYKCWQKSLNRFVALKLISPKNGLDELLNKRLEREAKVLAQLDHTNIVRVHELRRKHGYRYFLMDYVEGQNLRQRLKQSPLKPLQIVQMALQVCDALEHAHGRGVVHRDIKPENILIDASRRVKLADFGLALVAESPAQKPRLTLVGQLLGTPDYMSPEQREPPHQVDHRSDIYSLGVVLYEALTGEKPLGVFAPPSQKAGVDARYDTLVLKALANNPADRYQDVSELRLELAAIVEGRAASKPPGLPADEQGRLNRRLETCRQQLRQNPRDVDALKGLRDTLAQLGKTDPIPFLSYELATQYRQRGNLAKAVVTLEELSSQLSADNPRSLRLLERVQGDLEALDFNRLKAGGMASLVRRWPTEYGHADAVRAAEQSRRSAIVSYRQHVREHPEDHWAVQALAELEQQNGGGYG
jgi:serine/threonine protein kinase